MAATLAAGLHALAGHDDRLGASDDQGVLELRAYAAIRRAQRPAIVVLDEVVGASQTSRF
ncbi:MAG TPA: hypothetical protein VJN18_15515 [Polyangiaceae bacterium]|nr:hypothetical protein [Polyangiaceae bacterium]